MSNTIQMKRGSGKPDNKLAPYELGIDIDDGQLYFGGPIDNNKYGEAQGLKVAEASMAQIAKGAEKIVNNNGQSVTIGSATTPIFLQEGEFRTCGGSSISGTIEKAEMLATPREIKVDLAATEFAKFNGQQNITTGVTGTLSINKGGTGATTADAARTNLGLTKSDLVNLIYPVGSIYMSVNSVSPGTLFGGTWIAITGKFLLAQNPNNDAYKAGQTGGSTTATLTVNNLPSHSHSGIYYTNDSNVTSQVSFNTGNQGYKIGYGKDDAAADTASRFKTGNTGNGASFSIMPPYLSVYVWKRTA